MTKEEISNVVRGKRSEIAGITALEVVNAGNCMICGKPLALTPARGSGKLPNIFFCKDCFKIVIKEDTKTELKKSMKPHNCMECENSHITIQNGYCRCKVTGNCYSPIIMADKISEDCPLYESESEE